MSKSQVSVENITCGSEPFPASVTDKSCCPTNLQSWFLRLHHHVLIWRHKSVTSTCPLLRLHPNRPDLKRRFGLTQYSRGALLGRSGRLRPVRVPLLWSVSVPGALGAVAGGGHTSSGGGRCSRGRCRPCVGHALSISGERRQMKIFSGKLCSGVASQADGGAWV